LTCAVLKVFTLVGDNFASGTDLKPVAPSFTSALLKRSLMPVAESLVARFVFGKDLASFTEFDLVVAITISSALLLMAE
jgi:hypothetical protein